MSAWQATCERKVELARGWDMSERLNRASLRHWTRALWWARYGEYVWAAGGALAGVTIALGALSLLP